MRVFRAGILLQPCSARQVRVWAELRMGLLLRAFLQLDSPFFSLGLGLGRRGFLSSVPSGVPFYLESRDRGLAQDEAVGQRIFGARQTLCSVLG